MRNIFLFIRLYFNLIFFLILQGLCIYLIVNYSKYHHAVFGNFANQLTGKVNSQYSRIDNYFHLKKTNDSLVKANEALYNKLKIDFNLPDTVSKTTIDTITIDSVLQYRTYTYLNAKVVSNSVSAPNNYIILSRGTAQKLHVGMGVVDINNAVVGAITECTNDYSVVMSLLHKDSKLSGKLLKGGEIGNLSWDGKEPNILTLSNITKGAKITKGDTVITWYSTFFPKGIIIGTVLGIYSEKSSNSYTIKLKSAANFYDIQYVYAIDNTQQEPVNKILDKLKQQH